MVPTSSLILMALNAVLSTAVVVGLAWWLIRKHHARFSTILIGAGTFIVFALILESIMHQMVLKGPAGAGILGNTLLYAIYGGLAAGIFEETGRFISMKYLMRDEPSGPIPGVAYGIGHGGAEVIIIFTLTMVSNLVISALINSGQTGILFAKVPADAASQVQAQLDQLTSATAGTWLIGLWERFSALILHVGLSILVWAAVRKGGKWMWLFPAAILLHALVDAGAVLLQKSIGMVPLELVIFAASLSIAALAYLISRKL